GVAADRDHGLGEGEPVAGGQHDGPGARPAAPLEHPAGDREGAGAEPGVLLEHDLHWAHERVALVAGVLAGRVGQLAAEAVLHALELVEVTGGEGHDEVVGHERAAADADRAVVVHLPDEATAELDGADPALEGTWEHALHGPLQAP